MYAEFEYTHTAPVESSAVDDVYYNEVTKELAVNLHDEVYVYQNVPKSRYEALVNAPSVGRAYREVKNDYGPSEHLGYFDEEDFVKAFAAADMSAVSEPLVNEWVNVFDEPKVQEFGQVAPTDFTPKGLVMSPTGRSTGPQISLRPPVVAPTGRFRVGFEFKGEPFAHEVTSKDVESAKAEVENFFAGVGMEIKVKEVTTYFE